MIFLLTRPSRDVTSPFLLIVSIDIFLLTRPSRDVTLCVVAIFPDREISTHTPLAGRDKNVRPGNSQNAEFLLTRPSRDVTFMHFVHVHMK